MIFMSELFGNFDLIGDILDAKLNWTYIATWHGLSTFKDSLVMV